MLLNQKCSRHNIWLQAIHNVLLKIRHALNILGRKFSLTLRVTHKSDLLTGIHEDNNFCPILSR